MNDDENDVEMVDEPKRAAAEQAYRAAVLEMAAAGINENDALGIFFQMSVVGLAQCGLPVEELHATVDRAVARLEALHPYSVPKGRA